MSDKEFMVTSWFKDFYIDLWNKTTRIEKDDILNCRDWKIQYFLNDNWHDWSHPYSLLEINDDLKFRLKPFESASSLIDKISTTL